MAFCWHFLDGLWLYVLVLLFMLSRINDQSCGVSLHSEQAVAASGPTTPCSYPTVCDLTQPQAFSQATEPPSLHAVASKSRRSAITEALHAPGKVSFTGKLFIELLIEPGIVFAKPSARLRSRPAAPFAIVSNEASI